jgi:hypothetical protein
VLLGKPRAYTRARTWMLVAAASVPFHNGTKPCEDKAAPLKAATQVADLRVMLCHVQMCMM